MLKADQKSKTKLSNLLEKINKNHGIQLLWVRQKNKWNVWVSPREMLWVYGLVNGYVEKVYLIYKIMIYIFVVFLLL